MSCAEYSEGCYLLNHDDVIGTRRISFILYLVLDEPAWQPEVSCFGDAWGATTDVIKSQWGGALELYPVMEADAGNPDRPNIPHSKPTKSIPVRQARSAVRCTSTDPAHHTARFQPVRILRSPARALVPLG